MDLKKKIVLSRVCHADFVLTLNFWKRNSILSHSWRWLARPPQRAKSLIKAPLSHSEAAVLPVLIWINCLGEGKCHCLFIFLTQPEVELPSLGLQQNEAMALGLQADHPISFTPHSQQGRSCPSGRLSPSAHFSPGQHVWGPFFQDTAVQVPLRTMWETDNEWPE